MNASAARVSPGRRREIGAVNMALSRAIGLFAPHGGAPNLFTTLGRHRRLFRAWLLFAGTLMPGGRLPRADTELVILRVSHNCGCEYERTHHEPLARRAGLSPTQIARAGSEPDEPLWSARQRILLQAVDELHEWRVISDELWSRLSLAGFSEIELIELCMLVGHYEMLAMTINSLAIRTEGKR